MIPDDPDAHQIRQEFLEYVKRFHEEHEFASDWKMLCERLCVPVHAASSNQYTRLKGNPIICYNADEPANRQIFTGLNELSHHLFATADAGFLALLRDKYESKIAEAFEEDFCNQAASLLLFPDHVVHKVIGEHGYSPESIFELTQRPASRAAALMRIIKSHSLEWWGLIMTHDGCIEFSCTTSRYTLGKNHFIERGHRIHEAWSGTLEIAAPLPYASGDRKVKKRCVQVRTAKEL